MSNHKILSEDKNIRTVKCNDSCLYFKTRVGKGRPARVGLGQKVDPKNRPDFWPFFDPFRPFNKGAKYCIKTLKCPQNLIKALCNWSNHLHLFNPDKYLIKSDYKFMSISYKVNLSVLNRSNLYKTTRIFDPWVDLIFWPPDPTRLDLCQPYSKPCSTFYSPIFEFSMMLDHKILSHWNRDCVMFLVSL